MDSPAMSFYPAVSYGRAEHPLELDILAPPREPGGAPLPVALFFHGGGWHEGDRGAGMHPWLNPLLAARGYVTVSVTYRLSGAAPWPAQYDDARAALTWVQTHIADVGGDPSRIGVWGFSAGAHLAAHLAFREPGIARAASLAAGPTDLRGVGIDEPNEVTWLMGPSPAADFLADVSPITWVTPDAPPTLIVHGTDDQIVEFEQALALRGALAAVGARVGLHTIPGGSHEWADKPSADSHATFGDLTADFFDRVL
ncbi:alpha/beta hydrolase [Herbiconiux sp. SALV-R1]|uniref:alpha/beta hydrolase n=1 Tax=unclassified Herbiconiux TaxID=2618217 RepID=UPI00149123E9|nr:alpha/beta hydrolase [Herbiconiux sp. SALV-R1]QJU52687.1 alpha/beta hydrolase [Herbiconiux sp. SALV-R1]